VHLPADAELDNAYIWLHFQALTLNSNNGAYNLRVGYGAFPAASDPLWDLDCATASTGDCVTFIPVEPGNATIRLTLTPTCPSGCIETKEWAVETALVSSSNPPPYDYKPQQLVFQQRSAHFHTKTDEDPYVNFFTTFASAARVYFRLDAVDEATDIDEQGVEFVIWYGNNATEWPTADFYSSRYPEVDTEEGSFVMKSGFQVSAGAGKFAVQTVTNPVAGVADWSIKAGLNELPCAAAFSTQASLFVLLLAPLALLFNKLF
jgi:hypothetical protein